jgi:hypothetical protein
MTTKKKLRKRPTAVFDEAELLKKSYLTEEEASQLSRRAVQTLRNDRHRRRGFPYVKVGRSILYKKIDLIDAMEAGRVDPKE